MKNTTFPVVPKEFTDQLIKDGWHVMQETPSIPLAKEEEQDINYLTPEQIEAARKSILEAEERILSLMKESNTEMLDLSLEKEHMTKLIASGLNVEKELEQYRGKLLADEQHQFESEVLQKIQQVKETIAEMCKKALSEHQCEGVVPGTFIACGEGDYQYCSEACLTIAKQAKAIQLAYKERDAEEEEELHLDSMKLELPKEGGKVIPIIIGEPLRFRSREEDEK